MKNILIILIALFISGNAISQGHNIAVKINGDYSAPVYLGYHYGSITFLVDTAESDTLGNYTFSKKENLGEGVYFIYLENKTYFDFLIGKNQKFTINIDLNSKTKSISFENTKQNTNFLAFQTEISKMHQQSSYMVGRLQRHKNNPDSVVKVQNEIYAFNKTIRDFRLKTVEENKGTLFAAIISAMIEPDINEFNSRPQNTNTSTQAKLRYAFYKEHYFDNYDFSDTRLLRTELLENKIRTFYESVVNQHPDSIILESNKLLKKAEVNGYVYRFTFEWLLHKYENSKRVGYDKVFVNLTKNTILNNKTPWLSPQQIEGYRQVVDLIKPTLISEIAPELNLPNKNNEKISLSRSYADVTILVFYQLDQEESNVLLNKIATDLDEFADKDIMVYTVCINSNFDVWKTMPLIEKKGWENVSDINNSVSESNYYIEQAPRVFILNHNKKIVSNRVAPNDIKRVLSRVL